MYGFDKRTLVRALSVQQQRIVGRKAGRKPFRILQKNVLLVIDSFEQLDFHAIERLYWLEPLSVGMPDECTGAVQVAFALRLWGNALAILESNWINLSSSIITFQQPNFERRNLLGHS